MTGVEIQSWVLNPLGHPGTPHPTWTWFHQVPELKKGTGPFLKRKVISIFFEALRFHVLRAGATVTRCMETQGPFWRLEQPWVTGSERAVISVLQFQVTELSQQPRESTRGTSAPERCVISSAPKLYPVRLGTVDWVEPCPGSPGMCEVISSYCLKLLTEC